MALYALTDTRDDGCVWQRDLPYIDPLDAVAMLPAASVFAFFDSRGDVGVNARYSYLCVDPFSIITAHGDETRIDGIIASGMPLDVLAEALGRFRLSTEPGGFPFRGGVAGYIGYEAGAKLESVSVKPPMPDDPPDLFMGCYDVVIGFDRLARVCRVHASGLPHTQSAARAAHALERLDWACALLGANCPTPARSLPWLSWQADWQPAEYHAKISRVLEYIAAGDIYQANLTMRHIAARPPDLQAHLVYAALRLANPAPFAAWLHCGPHDLCCSSPERFISLTAGGAIETNPIKGTIARGFGAKADMASRARLAGSAKDRAENVMIVDVLRNDLGRVAVQGSVAVPDLNLLVSYATLHHLVSRITARLRSDLGAIDLLRATFPGGSITGAPKIRAMQIIAMMEDARRGIYCGCATWIGFDGAMDSNIVIRSLVLTPERVIAQAGGGIVADSTADVEYNEMMLKISPMMDIFGKSA